MVRSRWVQAAIGGIVVLAVAGAVTLFRVAGDNSETDSASAQTLAAEQATDSLSPLGVAQQQQEDETPWLGVMLVQTPDGATVAQVVADSPADAGGLQRGDVIESVDGTAVDNVREFREQLAGKNVGDTVALSISRGGQAQDISVTLEARPEPLPRAIPMLPELEGIPVDELFSHIQGGEFRFTDQDGNAVTAVLEAGTVASVDGGAGTLTVNLNAGGSKTYTVEADDLIAPGALTDLESGGKVVVMTVNDDVRAVLAGGRLPFIPGLGGKHGGFGFGHGRPGSGGFWDGGPGWFSAPDALPEPSHPGTGM